MLENQDHLVQHIRIDEGGELGRCTEYLKLLHEMGIVIEITVEYKSISNTKVESPMRINYQLTWIALAMSGLPIELWCFA